MKPEVHLTPPWQPRGPCRGPCLGRIDASAGSYPGSTATARASAISQASETRSTGAHTHVHKRHALHTHVRTAEVGCELVLDSWCAHAEQKLFCTARATFSSTQTISASPRSLQKMLLSRVESVPLRPAL